ARVIWVKLRLKQAFPNDFTEALAPGGTVLPPSVFPPLPTFQKFLNGAGVSYDETTATLTGGPGQPTGPALSPLLALQQGQGGLGISAEDIGSSFLREVPNATGSARVNLIVDGWANPLAFCRSPWQSDVLNPGATHIQAGLQDPGDPRGLLTESA